MTYSFNPQPGKCYYVVIDSEIFVGKFTGTHGTKYYLFSIYGKRFVRGVFVPAWHIFQFVDNAKACIDLQRK
jgi:hypothetical protein